MTGLDVAPGIDTGVDVNVAGTLNLLEAAGRAGHERFVMTSSTSLVISRAVRDETSSAAVWLDEGFAPLAPRNVYGVTKLAAESLCRMHARAGAAAHHRAGVRRLARRPHGGRL